MGLHAEITRRLAEERVDEMLAEAQRDRLARQAERVTPSDSQSTDDRPAPARRPLRWLAPIRLP